MGSAGGLPPHEQVAPRPAASDDLERYRLLASAMAGRSLRVVPAPEGDATYTDGSAIYLAPGSSRHDELVGLAVQCALLASGGLEPSLMRRLRGRPKATRRYLALEARRSLAAMSERLPAAVAVAAGPPGTSVPATPEESLAQALGRWPVPESPPAFGVIRPGAVLTVAREEAETAAGAPSPQDLAAPYVEEDVLAEADDDEESQSMGTFSRMMQNGFQTPFSLWVTKLLGGKGSPSDGDGGAELPVGAARAVDRVGANAQVASFPAPLERSQTQVEGGVGWAYPEWDVFGQSYRHDWCLVTEFDARPALATPPPGRSNDLRRRLARLGVGLERRRRELQGDDVDLDAAVEARVATMTRSSPAERLYIDTQRRKRSLATLLLVDASGSTGEKVGGAGDVLRRQREASALMLDTLTHLGDRVALYGFRSRGRSAVSILRIKAFDDLLGQSVYERLGGLTPGGYTRLGAAIRHGSHLLDTEGGTDRRLLVVLSDGFAYDDGYQGRYAESDARRALAEARRQGIGCLCLTLGGTNDMATLRRVFGTAAHGQAKEFDELIPDLGRLFRRALANADLQRRLAQREQRRSQVRDTRGAA
jgi:nitric oxide reductase NorD protein